MNAGLGLPVRKELGHREPSVFGDLPKKNGRNIAPGVEWNSGDSTGRTAELLVRTTLPHFNEA